MPKDIKGMTFEDLVDEFEKALRDYNLAFFNCMCERGRVDETKARADEVKSALLRRYSSAVSALRREEHNHFVRTVSG